MFFIIGILKSFANFIEKDLCGSLFLTKLQGFRPATLLKRGFNTSVFANSNFIKKETPAQVFSCGEFCEISKNTFSYRTRPVAASVVTSKYCVKPNH